MANLEVVWFGALGKAEAVLQTAMSLSPDQPDFAGLLPDVLVQQHKYDDGLAMADKALALASKTASVEIIWSDAFQSPGRHRAILTQLDEAAKPDPSNAEIAVM